jgi:conjugative transfer region lipoprotein (TIGR03751 family)
MSGCAMQDTILPVSEQEMIDIYRNALREVSASDSGIVDPAALCADVALDDETSVEHCIEVLASHTQDAYRRIDTQGGEAIAYEPYTRDAQSEIENLFPRLRNPDIVIYVYPHLATAARAPIPGYSTVIPLYNQVEYRLPGEKLLGTPEAAAAVAVGDAP